MNIPMKSPIKLMLAGLLTISLLLTGCSAGGDESAEQDRKSLDAIPYTLYGENEYWTAAYTITAISEDEKQSQQQTLNTIKDRFGGDSDAYRQQQQYSPVYTGVFSLTFKGDEAELASIKKYTITFAPGTDYQKISAMQRNSGQAGFDESLTGQSPLFTASFAEDASILEKIPPVDGAYKLTIKTDGYKDAAGTLTMQFKQ